MNCFASAASDCPCLILNICVCKKQVIYRGWRGVVRGKAAIIFLRIAVCTTSVH